MQELKLALREIRHKDFRDNNGHFQVMFLTCNRTEQTGGELIDLPEASGCGIPPNCKDHEMIGIRCNQTGKRYAVHNRLIFQLNNQDIFWI